MALEDYSSALVTGASSGIGAAVVARLARGGLTVHAVARRQDRLDQLAAATGCQIHRVDLRDRQSLYDTLGALDADILVNNAGLGRGFGHIYEVDPDDIDTTIGTNVQAALHVLRAVTPGMVARKRGHIVNIGSVAGLYPVNSAVYGASKGAIRLLHQNLRLDLRGTGIKTTEICPGRVHTEFFNVAYEESPEKQRDMVSGFELLTPDDIAEAILFALDTPWRMNVGLIEIVPTEQAYGGIDVTPRPRS